MSTVYVPEGPAANAVLPARSLAVPAAIEIPNVPLPVAEVIVTVAPVVDVPETATVPPVPLVFKVTFAATRETESAPL